MAGAGVDNPAIRLADDHHIHFASTDRPYQRGYTESAVHQVEGLLVVHHGAYQLGKRSFDSLMELGLDRRAVGPEPEKSAVGEAQFQARHTCELRRADPFFKRTELALAAQYL